VYRLLFSLASISVSAGLLAQPLIAPKGIVNAASFMAPSLGGGSIARGSVFTLFGARMGPDTSPGLAFPLSTTLGGVSVKVIPISGSPVDAYPIFVGPSQINAIMPSNVALGMASVQVTFNNAKSNMGPVRIVNSSLGIFAVRAGMGPGIFFNFVSQDQQPLNAPAVTAIPGGVVTLYGTGLGPVSFADNVAPTAGNLPIQTEVFVGGKSASVQYNGRTPCCSGVDQVVFTVPPDAPTGCYVPVTVRTAGTTSSNTVTMAIASDGSRCSDPGNPIAQSIINGGKFGAVVLARTNMHEDLGLKAPVDVTIDNAVVNLRQEKGDPFAFNPLFSYPPPGSCTVYAASVDLFSSDNLPLTATTGKYLDAGSSMFKLQGALGTRDVMPSIPPLNPIFNFWQFGKNIPNSGLRDSTLLTTGDFTLRVGGGADVGQFQTTITNPSPLSWTNRDQVANVTRTQPLTINWSGGPPNVPVAIIGANVDIPTNSTGLFFCVAPAGSTSFAVPAYVLANIPATRSRPIASKGVLYVGAMTLASPTNFNAPGLDLGVAAATTFSARPVIFK
jgi:uncharacterized protein (TIGR03437 family)